MAKNFRDLQQQVRARPGAPERLAALRQKTLAEIALYDLRREREITQASLAETLDISQPAVSKIEHADDIRVSTLRNYLHGLGAELQLQAVFSDGETIAIAINR